MGQRIIIVFWRDYVTIYCFALPFNMLHVGGLGGDKSARSKSVFPMGTRIELAYVRPAGVILPSFGIFCNIP